jgi:hypothetical protein
MFQITMPAAKVFGFRSAFYALCFVQLGAGFSYRVAENLSTKIRAFFQ